MKLCSAYWTRTVLSPKTYNTTKFFIGKGIQEANYDGTVLQGLACDPASIYSIGYHSSMSLIANK